jgi:hypothetical protein
LRQWPRTASATVAKSRPRASWLYVTILPTQCSGTEWPIANGGPSAAVCRCGSHELIGILLPLTQSVGTQVRSPWSGSLSPRSAHLRASGRTSHERVRFDRTRARDIPKKNGPPLAAILFKKSETMKRLQGNEIALELRILENPCAEGNTPLIVLAPGTMSEPQTKVTTKSTRDTAFGSLRESAGT